MDHKTEQDAGLLEQGASMLEEHAEEQRTRGNDSAAEGAACSAHAIRRLAPALLRAGRGCLAQIEEPPTPAAVTPQGEWRIDTSAGREILVYKNCSVIEDADARYVLSLIAAASQPAAVAPEHPPMPETWAVVASIEGQDVVCISSNALSGKGELTESEEQAVIGMAQHLLAFVGYGLPPCDFDPDYEPAPAPALEAPAAPSRTSVAVLLCDCCGHIGINDAADGKAACNTCRWTGDSPAEDKCPACNRVGTMTSACPECGARTSLIAETHLPAAAPQAPAAPVAAAIPDAAYCALQYVEHALAAIANREELADGAFQPMDSIGKASKRAKAALARLQSVAHHFSAVAAPAAPAVDAADSARLDFVLKNDAFIAWTERDGTIVQCQLLTQDEDEHYHVISGEHRFFNTPREAIDAAIAAQAKEGGEA